MHTQDDKPLKLEVKSKPRPFAQALWEFYQEIDSHRPYLRPSSLLYLIGQKYVFFNSEYTISTIAIIVPVTDKSLVGLYFGTEIWWSNAQLPYASNNLLTTLSQL